MKYTTLPTKPGRYIDCTGDAWTLKENFGWECELLSNGGSRTEAEKWLPFTDAPDDDKPTSTDDKMQRIDNVDDLEAGDLVYFRDDTRMPLLVLWPDRSTRSHGSRGIRVYYSRKSNG